jgi:hypothetical protein
MAEIAREATANFQFTAAEKNGRNFQTFKSSQLVAGQRRDIG